MLKPVRLVMSEIGAWLPAVGVIVDVGSVAVVTPERLQHIQ